MKTRSLPFVLSARSLTKRKISKLPPSAGISVEETIVDLLVASEGRVITIMECLSEENVKKAIKHPLSIIASDGAGYSIAHKETGELVHPQLLWNLSADFGKICPGRKISDS